MANRKAIYFTSDTHYFHKKSIEFDKRPFQDIEHMHRVMVNNYNAVVPESGVCYFLGDFGMGPAKEMKELVNSLNGTKVLVLGNHDKKHNSMYNMGFDVVVNSASIKIAGEIVTMSHCPLRGIVREDTSNMRGTVEGEHWHGESRHTDYSVENFGQYHLHGHIHSPNRGRSKTILDKQFDIGVVANNYRPVSISVIESWVAKDKDVTQN